MTASTKVEPPKEKDGVTVKKLVRKLFFPCKHGDCSDCIGEFIRPKGPLKGTLYQCQCKHHNNQEYMRRYMRDKNAKKRGTKKKKRS